MGTSTKYPTHKALTGVRTRLGNWLRHDDPARFERAIPAYVDLLTQGGRGWGAVPRQRAALAESAPRFCETLADLDSVVDATRRRTPQPELGDPDLLRERFAATFADRICGDSLVSDAVTRRAAMNTADELLARSPAIERALLSGGPGAGIDDALFCFLYRHFFGDVVTELLLTAMTESLCLGIPGASLLFRYDVVAEPVHKLLAGVLPNPCAHRQAATSAERLHRPIHRVASALTDDTLTTLFGPAPEDLAA